MHVQLELLHDGVQVVLLYQWLVVPKTKVIKLSNIVIGQQFDPYALTVTKYTVAEME